MGFFITFVIFSRYVYNQKQQIGTLMTFGYKKSDITQYFLRIFLLISLITIPLSIVIGYTIGWAILGAVVSNVANLSVSNLAFMFIPEIIYLGLGLVFLITFVSLYLPVISVKRTKVSDLVYGQSKTKFSIIRLRNSLKPKKRISSNLIHRNLFRHKKRLLFTTIAMTFSLLIISATQTIVDSMDYNVSRVFKSDNSNVQTNENWDLNIDFQNSINTSYINNTVDLVSDIQNIKEIQSYVKGLVTALGNEDQIFLLVGFHLENSTVHHFTWDNEQSGSSLPTEEDEIVISRQHSAKLNKKVGDLINITTSTGA
jgi:ABC-type lipoprotein release transport system permease subunit